MGNMNTLPHSTYTVPPRTQNNLTAIPCNTIPGHNRPTDQSHNRNTSAMASAATVAAATAPSEGEDALTGVDFGQCVTSIAAIRRDPEKASRSSVTRHVLMQLLLMRIQTEIASGGFRVRPALPGCDVELNAFLDEMRSTTPTTSPTADRLRKKLASRTKHPQPQPGIPTSKTLLTSLAAGLATKAGGSLCRKVLAALPNPPKAQWLQREKEHARTALMFYVTGVEDAMDILRAVPNDAGKGMYISTMIRRATGSIKSARALRQLSFCTPVLSRAVRVTMEDIVQGGLSTDMLGMVQKVHTGSVSAIVNLVGKGTASRISAAATGLPEDGSSRAAAVATKMRSSIALAQAEVARSHAATGGGAGAAAGAGVEASAGTGETATTGTADESFACNLGTYIDLGVGRPDKNGTIQYPPTESGKRVAQHASRVRRLVLELCRFMMGACAACGEYVVQPDGPVRTGVCATTAASPSSGGVNRIEVQFDKGAPKELSGCATCNLAFVCSPHCATLIQYAHKTFGCCLLEVAEDKFPSSAEAEAETGAAAEAEAETKK